MKTLLLTMLALCSMAASAQTKYTNIKKQNIAGINCLYAKSIDMEKKDTLYYTYFGFQDARYSHITSIASIMFANTDGLSEFLKDLKMAKENFTETNINWDRKDYRLRTSGKYLIIYEGEKINSGYTFISLTGLERLITWIETIEFGKD